MVPFEFDRAAALAAIEDFAAVYDSRPFQTNPGGMGFNHSFATWWILRTMRPTVVVESGVWRGHSTWLIENAAPEARLFCFDPRPDRRVYTSSRATYSSGDFSTFDWSGVATDQAIAFFDDHQNCYARLKTGFWFGFEHFIFEDNFPCGEGDAYSIRHVLGGCGHPHLQMSERYARRPRQVLKRLLIEPVARRLGSQQTAIVPPNTSDAANLRRWRTRYREIPPVAVPAKTHWGTPWVNAYACEPPLFPDIETLSSTLGTRADSWNLDYGYLCYVGLKHG